VWFLSFPRGTKARVNVVKIKAEVKLLNAELGRGGEDELKVKTGLFNNVKSRDV
jgi:hypothetical protein